jgi:hypothetical protein
MSPLWAALVVTWAGLALLYLAMIRLMVEMQKVRRDIFAAAGSQNRVDLPARKLPDLPERVRTVVVADRDCSFCHDVVGLMAARRPFSDFAILVHDEAESWLSEYPGVSAIVDAEAWKSFAPLSAPLLVSRGEGGQVADVVPPANLESVMRWLSEQEEKESVNE